MENNTLSPLLNVSGANFSERSTFLNSEAVSHIVIGSCTLLTNGFVLSLFIFFPHLRTPFTVYLINLLCANLIENLADILRIIDVSKTSWFNGSFLCIMLEYSDWVSCAVILHAHLLITVNRIWAITFPISFKNNHSMKTAFLICLGMFIYCNALPFPVLVRDALYFRLPPETVGCYIDTDQQLLYSQILQIWFYDGPLLFIVAAYPFLYCERKRRRRVSDPSTTHRLSLKFSPMSQWQILSRRNTVGEVEPSICTVQQPTAKVTQRHTDHSRAFVVLTLLTASITACYMPTKVYGTIETFANLELRTLSNISDIMFQLQAIMDPILFTLTLKNIREAAFTAVKNICKPFLRLFSSLFR